MIFLPVDYLLFFSFHFFAQLLRHPEDLCRTTLPHMATVLVLGATGKTGHHLVRQLLERSPVKVRALVRSPERLKELLGELPEERVKVTQCGSCGLFPRGLFNWVVPSHFLLFPTPFGKDKPY